MSRLIGLFAFVLAVSISATIAEAKPCPLSNGYLSDLPCWAQTSLDYNGR